jgi:hypothetical protein
MKLSEFILLDEANKKTTVLHEGILVAKRRDLNHLVFLFQMNDYYIETYCDMRSKAVCEYTAFRNINSLNPYLEEIEIDDLMC